MVLAPLPVEAPQGIRSVKRAVFLDRDGTLLKEVNYLSRKEDMELLPGIADALGRLKKAGFLLFVVTNQAGVARGRFGVETVRRVNRAFADALKAEGVELDGMAFCPHHPDFTGPCECRKPEPGMIFSVSVGKDVDFSRSYMVGDKASDIGAGKRAGLKTVLVLTGYGAEELEILKACGDQPDHVAKDLAEFSRLVTTDNPPVPESGSGT